MEKQMVGRGLSLPATRRDAGATPAEGVPEKTRLLWRLPLVALADLRERLRDRRFWAVQAMVIAVTAAHSTLEVLEKFAGQDMGAMYFVPASLYFIPVVYASLNFGVRGAVPTAVWSAILAVPNIIVWHEGLERMGEALQMAMLVALAIVIAGRVDRETAARRQAEAGEKARLASELKYRQLFSSVAEPILVVDTEGIIHESNAAAAALLGRPRGGMHGASLKDGLGETAARQLLEIAAGKGEEAELSFKQADGGETWLEPLCTPVISEEHGVLMQVLLRDVTERRSLESYAREIARAQEEERQHIAHELHDVALQSLVLLCRRLDAIQERYGEGMPETTARAVAEARGSAEELADQLRRFARDLRPAVLDGLGLVPAVKRLVGELSERTGVNGRFETRGTGSLERAGELPLFRICQEALRNVERHSGASAVTVRLSYEPGGVRLVVADNGCGFEVPSFGTLAARGSFGLLGIRERTRLLGGKCRISSTPGKGTRVEVRLANGNGEGPGPAAGREHKEVSDA